MKRILFLCNTHMQVIVAIKLKMSIFDKDSVDIVISDCSRDADILADRLREMNLFSHVVYIKYKEILFAENTAKTVTDLVDFLTSKKRYRRLTEQFCFPYDSIFFYNISLLLYYCYDESVRSRKAVSCYRFEEGILSYYNMLRSSYGTRFRAINFLRRLTQKDIIFDKVSGYWCFFPQLLGVNEKMCNSIPILERSDSAFLQVINKAFEYNPLKDNFFRKIIYFATSSDIDNCPVGETELVLKIAEVVGKENLIVKIHPRDTRTVYEEKGLVVSRSSATPWEVIQLNHNMSNCIFLSLSSGSILNASVMLGDMVDTYYLYPLVKGKNKAFDQRCKEEISVLINELKECGRGKNIKIITEFELLKRILSGTGQRECEESTEERIL